MGQYEDAPCPADPHLACDAWGSRASAEGPPKDRQWKPEDYVFSNEIGERIKTDIKAAWQGTCERAKIDDLHFHDLRHEAGSRKLEAGWPLHAVSRWLGHTKLTMTDTYLNATTQLLHELNERKPLALAKA